MMPNHEKKRDYYVNPCLSQIERQTSILKKVVREAFLLKPKHQHHLSQRGECVYDPHS